MEEKAKEVPDDKKELEVMEVGKPKKKEDSFTRINHFDIFEMKGIQLYTAYFLSSSYIDLYIFLELLKLMIHSKASN